MRKYVAGFIAGLVLIPTLSLGAELRLNWTDLATNEAEYRVQRSLTGNTVDFTTIKTGLAANTVTYTDTGLAEDVMYYYRVGACNTSGCGWSAIASGKTTISIPAAPTGLTVTPLP